MAILHAEQGLCDKTMIIDNRAKQERQNRSRSIAELLKPNTAMWNRNKSDQRAHCNNWKSNTDLKEISNVCAVYLWKIIGKKEKEKQIQRLVKESTTNN